MLLLFAVAGPPCWAGEPTPERTVERLHDALTHVMQQAPQLGFAGRKATLATTVASSYDFASIARLVLGRHWRELSPEQRDAMAVTLEQLTVVTYAARFDGFEGERFALVSSAPKAKQRVLVRTLLSRAGGDDVALDYLLQHAPEAGWRIVNVWADGVSEISLKRADYSKVMRQEGFEVLLEVVAGQKNRIERDARG